MSREIKRVALDFDWPLNKVWPGYDFETPDCNGQCPPDDEPFEVEKQCTWHRMLWDDYGLYPKVDPLAGDGWQVWESVSEGSPITQVFPTAEALIEHLTTVPLGGIYDTPFTRPQAERFVEVGSSMGSMAVIGGKFVDGIRALSEPKDGA